MSKRKDVPNEVETEVLLRSGRRCCICFGLYGDMRTKQGQITHLDHNPGNNNLDNLAFLCLEHHDQYDTRTSQGKGWTVAEVRHYRVSLYKGIEDLQRLQRDGVSGDSSAIVEKRLSKETQGVQDKRVAEAELMLAFREWWASISDYERSGREMVGSASQAGLMPETPEMGIQLGNFEVVKTKTWPFLSAETRRVAKHTEETFLEFMADVYAGMYNHEVYGDLVPKEVMRNQRIEEMIFSHSRLSTFADCEQAYRELQMQFEGSVANETWGYSPPIVAAQAATSGGSAAWSMPELLPSHREARVVSPEENGLSIRHQLAEARENLRLIKERQAEFVLSTDIPLQLIKEERLLLDRIAELEQQLVEPTVPGGPGPRSDGMKSTTEELPQIDIGEFVGRDKITIHALPPDKAQPSQLPRLALKLLKPSDRTHRDEITFGQVSGVLYREFGLALENVVASTTATGIDIRVEIDWQGDELKQTPEFLVHLPPSEGWKAEVNRITHDQPAILTFHGLEYHRCVFRQPLVWNNLVLHLEGQVRGFFHIQYVVSSSQPVTENSGELRIIIGG